MNRTLFAGFDPHYVLSFDRPRAATCVEIDAIVHARVAYADPAAGIPAGTYDVVTAQGAGLLVDTARPELMYAFGACDLLGASLAPLRSSVAPWLWPVLSERGVVAFVEHDLPLIDHLRPPGTPRHGTECPSCRFLGTVPDGERELDAYVCMSTGAPRLLGRIVRGVVPCVGFPVHGIEHLPFGATARTAYRALLQRMDRLDADGRVQTPRPLRASALS